MYQSRADLGADVGVGYLKISDSEGEKKGNLSCDQSIIIYEGSITRGGGDQRRQGEA